MDQRSRGVYSSLKISSVYNASQDVFGSTKALKRLVAEHVKPPVDGTVLDLGAGTGAVQRYLPGCRYTAVEPNPRYVRRMTSRFQGSDNVAIEGSAPDILPMQQKFDRVLVLGVLHHVDDDTARDLLRFASDQLAPGGSVVTFDPVVGPATPRSARIAMSLDRGRNIRTSAGYNQLAEPYFQQRSADTRDDLLRIPWHHYIMSLSAPVERSA